VLKKLRLWQIGLAALLVVDAAAGLGRWLWFFLNRSSVQARIRRLLLGSRRSCALLLAGWILCSLCAGCGAVQERYRDLSLFSGDRYNLDKAMESLEETIDPGTTSWWSPFELLEETVFEVRPDADRTILWEIDAFLSP